MRSYEEKSRGMIPSDLLILEGFLHEDVVYYFVQKAGVVSDGQMIVFPKGSGIYIISWLQKQADNLGYKFFELSFQQKKALIDKFFNNEHIYTKVET